MTRRTIVPNEQCPAAMIEPLLRHPSAQARGEGFFFREMVRYFHWPYQDMQQEGMDPGPLHSKLRSLTARLFKRFGEEGYGETIATRLTEEWIDGLEDVSTLNLVSSLRPIVVQVFFELLFHRRMTERELDLYVEVAGNFNDVLKSLGVTSKRPRRLMYEDLLAQVEQGDFDELFDDALSREENVDRIAQHVGTTLLYTGVLQTVEYATHTLTALAQHPVELERVRNSSDDGGEVLGRAMSEAMRLFPLFGRTNRVVTEAFEHGEADFGTGDVIYLEFGKLHRQHWPASDEFIPDRFDAGSSAYAGEELCSQHFIPFGAGPRACPAQELSTRISRGIMTVVLHRLNLLIPERFHHTRRIALGVPAVAVRRDASAEPDRAQTALSELNARCVVDDSRVLFPAPSLLPFLQAAVSTGMKLSRFHGSWLPCVRMSLSINYSRYLRKLRGMAGVGQQ